MKPADVPKDLLSRNDPDALATLMALAQDRDEYTRSLAVNIIGRHPRGHDMGQAVLTALTDPSGYVLRAACAVVTGWRWADAHDRVVALLGARDLATRSAALRALQEIGTDHDHSMVLKLYQRDPATEVRRQAAWVLRSIASTSNWQVTFDAFVRDLETARHRAWAAALAAQFGRSEQREALFTLADDIDGHVRLAARRAIAALENREAV